MANCSSPYGQMKSSFEIGDMYSRLFDRFISEA